MLHVDKSPLVSIIIPCYNHGKFIDEALNSIKKIENQDLYEIIIINDGSTDDFTNRRLRQIADKGYYVIFQENKGLATSRNNGIKISRGKYILPLDADNMIRPEYLYKGIEILDSNEDVDIVFGNASLFGESEGVLRPGEYNLQKLMLRNYIDACAIYRKTVWDATGGYDMNMAFPGIEDWDLWLNASFKGFKFCYVDEVLFDYRVLGNSMIRGLNASKIKGDANVEYMIAKHQNSYGPQYIDEDIMNKFSTSPIGFIGKLLLKKYFPNRFHRMVKEGKLRKYI